VVERGTATKLKDLNRPLAGKTGTTNDSRDTWFIGFSPDLVVGVFVGYDEPRNMGKKETGASVAVPIFKDFMAAALKDAPPMPFRIPPGVRQVQINRHTGARASYEDSDVIWESFIADTEPEGSQSYVLDGDSSGIMPAAGSGDGYGGDDFTFEPSAEAATTGTGGLY
jgi:penicillin-binding protein 1A